MEVNGERTIPKRLGTSAKKRTRSRARIKKSSLFLPLLSKPQKGCGFVGVVLLFLKKEEIMKIAGKSFSCLKGVVAGVSNSEKSTQEKEEEVLKKVNADHHLYRNIPGEFFCPKCGAEMVWEGRAEQPEEKIDVFSSGSELFRCQKCDHAQYSRVWERVDVEGIHYKVVFCDGCGREGRASVRSSGPHYCGVCAMNDYLSNPKY